MSIIDWSDPEEMLGLLAESVRDELTAEAGDEERVSFLQMLSAAVDSLATRAGAPARTLLAELREIHDEQPAGFAEDPVSIHVRDCIEELARIVAAEGA